MSISPTVNSPKSTNSPREKRFTFFRSRTLSGSSNESSGPSSPRLSPRSLFDKVRKRSSNDVKNAHNSPQSQPTASNLTVNENGVKKTLGPPLTSNNGVSSRKRLSHSISEENDDTTVNDANNNDFTEINYRTYHGTQSLKVKPSSSTNNQTKQLISNLNNLNVNCTNKVR